MVGPPAPPDREHTARDRLESVLGAAKEVGLSLDWAERATFWWKHLGWRAAVSFVVALLPFINAECQSRAANRIVGAIAEYTDTDIEVGDWSGQFFGTEATAKDIRVRSRGPFAKREVLTASAVRVDLSGWRWLRHNAGRLPWNWQAGDLLWTIEIDEPRLYIERRVSGASNLDEFAAPQDPGDVRQVADRDDGFALDIPHLEVRRANVEWVEHVPTQSTGGLLQTTTETMHIDDVYVRLDGSRLGGGGLVDSDSCLIEGRTANGKFSISCTALGTRPRGHRYLIVLDNVGAAAFARMLPPAAIVPESGSMSGRIEVTSRASARLECRSDVMLKDVTYKANPRAPLPRPRRLAVEHELASLAVDRGVLADCSDDPSRPGYHFVQTVQTSINQAALSTSPAVVRETAAFDYLQARGVPVMTDLGGAAQDALARQAGEAAAQMLGPEIGSAVTRSLSAPPPPGKAQPPDNAMARGMKSVGGGIKRLFGGGKKKTEADRNR